MSYKNKPMPFYLKEFLTYLRVVKNRSERTVDAYYVDLLNFLRFIKISKGLASNDSESNDVDITDIKIDVIMFIIIKKF